jgi:hypothetical protein
MNDWNKYTKKEKKTATVPKKPRQINQTKKQKEIMIASTHIKNTWQCL